MFKFVEKELGCFGNQYDVNVLFDTESVYQRIQVMENSFFGKMLVLDGFVQSTEKFEFIFNEMIVHNAMCLVDKEEMSVLVLGGGSCNTSRQILKHKNVKALVVCDIDIQVTDICKRFIPSFVDGVLCDDRVVFYHKDALTFIRDIESNSFDVIVVDGCDPISNGADLFGDQLFDESKRILKKDGVLSCHSGCPYVIPDTFVSTYKKMVDRFAFVKPLYAATPEFPGGIYSFIISTNKKNVAYIKKDIKGLKYFNENIFVGASMLPPYLNDLIVI